MASTFKISQEGRLLEPYTVKINVETDGDAEQASCRIRWMTSDNISGSTNLATDGTSATTINVNEAQTVTISVSSISASYGGLTGDDNECCNITANYDMGGNGKLSSNPNEIICDGAVEIWVMCYGEVC